MPTITPGRGTGRRIAGALRVLRTRGILRRRRIESLTGRLDHSMEHLSAEPLGRSTVEALRYFWLDGFYSAVSLNLYSGFVTLFALAYGANNAQVGQLTAVASLLAAISLFPGARLIGLFGKRKPIVTWFSAGVGRVALLVWACVPFVVHDPAVAITTMIALNALIGFMSNFSMPAWTSMVADIVPIHIRGRYFSSRNLVMSLVALLVVPLAGWLINAGNTVPGLPFGGYQLVFLLAFVIGLASTVSFQRIEEPPDPAAGAPSRGLKSLWLAFGSKPGFLGFVASAFVWNLALQVAGPFFNVYLVGSLGASTSTVGLLTSVTSLFALLSQRWLGNAVDRRGNLWMLGVTGALIPLMPLAWVFVNAPWQVSLINAASGILWTGYNLANFNLLLEMAPDEARADAAAFYQFVVMASAVVGPLLGGYLADTAGYKLVFGISAVGRWLGVLTFLWLAARPALRTRRIVR